MYLAPAASFVALAVSLAMACSMGDSSSSGPETPGAPAVQLTDRISSGIVLAGVDPPSGTTIGGTRVTVYGEGFESGATLTIGGLGTEATFVNSRSLSGITGAHSQGVVNVQVTNPGGDTGDLILGYKYVEPASFVPSTIRFEEVAAGADVAFKHFRDEFPTPFGGGTAVADFDGDGLLDIYVTNSAGPNALYRNDGNRRFTEVAAAAGVDDPAGHGNGAGWADYDNDGDLDLFVANFGASKLFRNRGDGTFADVTEEAGLSDPDDTYRTTGLTWGDFDRDGDLDLLVVRHFSEHDASAYVTGNYSEIARSLALYRNNGDSTFVNVTAVLGGAPNYSSNVTGAGFRPAFVDYDNDGDDDIYVVNDFGEAHQPNVLWRNDGPDGEGGWRFTDVSAASGANVALFGMGLAVGDFDNDGDFDLYMSNMRDGVFLNNLGDGTFADMTAQTRTGRGSIPENGLVDMSVSWGTVFEDFDNDGLLDIYLVAGYIDVDVSFNLQFQPNALFMNRGDGTFSDVSTESGTDDPGFGRGVAAADFDNDGRVDLFVVNLGKLDGTPGTARMYRNISQNDNNWLRIETIGTISNRNGIGAKISVVAGGVTMTRVMGVSQGHFSHSFVPVHFGLGTSTRADTVEVKWPSGKVQTMTGVAANQVLKVTEPGR